MKRIKLNSLAAMLRGQIVLKPAPHGMWWAEVYGTDCDTFVLANSRRSAEIELLGRLGAY